MRFVTFSEFAGLPIRPSEPGPCQARLPTGRQCHRPASRASGYHKCPVHDSNGSEARPSFQRSPAGR
jgi:hypothetical protein